MSHLTNTPIDAAQLVEGFGSTSHGAVVSFVGLVRDHHAGQQVVALHYECYGPMAEAECQQIISRAESDFGARVLIQHRLGDLVVGDVAVVVVSAAAHRDAAFAATRWVIDEVKRRVPIWKHERYADGTTAWVDPTSTTGIVR